MSGEGKEREPTPSLSQGLNPGRVRNMKRLTENVVVFLGIPSDVSHSVPLRHMQSSRVHLSLSHTPHALTRHMIGRQAPTYKHTNTWTNTSIYMYVLHLRSM